MGGVIYILRHGATKLNNQTDMSEDRIRGWTDVPLAEDGRKEAQAAAIKLKAKGVDAIVTSDLSRAKETAAIIGKILGVKPAVSRGLRPWNLGTFAGTSTKEALPKIAQYVHDKPDAAVPEGESFNQFKERAFAGLADAIESNQGKVLVIVTHHRNERLYEAWEKAGRPEDLSIDLPTFLQKGDPPGGIKELAIGDVEKWDPQGGTSAPSPASSMTTKTTISRKLSNGKSIDAGAPSASPAGKNGPSMPNPSDNPETRATKAEAHYGIAKSGSADRCGTCKSFRPPNDCIKVVPPIATAGWCRLGHSKTDGHAFYGEDESESEVMPAAHISNQSSEMRPSPSTAAGAEAAGPQPRSAMAAETMAHGRAIAGAKALHAVGHISEKQRDKHIGVSREAIAKAALFGKRA